MQLLPPLYSDNQKDWQCSIFLINYFFSKHLCLYPPKCWYFCSEISAVVFSPVNSRLQCRLVGTWCTYVWNDGGPVTIWYSWEFWQSWSEHRRLSFPRYVPWVLCFYLPLIWLYRYKGWYEQFFLAVILEKQIRIPRSLSVKAAGVLKSFLNKVRAKGDYLRLLKSSFLCVFLNLFTNWCVTNSIHAYFKQ